jgi:hypothetical protein
MSGFTLNDFMLAFLVLIGASIGGYLSYRGSQDAIKNQSKYEVKNIAKAIELDLQTIKKSPAFETAYILYKGDKSTLLNNETPDNEVKLFVPRDQFYNKETGLYFLYQRDIAKLNYELSFNIYEFYKNLVSAENNRMFLLQNLNFIDPPDPERMFKYRDMTNLIVKCGDSVPRLLEELSKAQNT